MDIFKKKVVLHSKNDLFYEWNIIIRAFYKQLN